MSNPENPLNKFRSYSYFHVLAACDSSETAAALTSTNVFTLHEARDPSDNLTPQTVNGGKYVILIDGSTDAQFVIQEAKWNTIVTTNLNTREGPMTSSAAYSEGTLTINEPYGVRFFDVLARVCDALNTDPIGLIFVLKTYFVGYHDDQMNGVQEVLTNIRPFWFVPIDIQAQFNETGAQYTIEFVGATNGISKLPHINDLCTGITITNNTLDLGGISKVTTLKDVFEKTLPAVLSQQYNAFVDAVKQKALQVGKDFNVNQFRAFEYRFDLDPAYQTSDYLFGDNEQQHKQDKPGVYVLSFSQRPTFEQIITQTMMSSKKVVQEANDPNTKYTFNITSAVTSTPTKFIITFYINRYEVTCQNKKNALPSTFPPKDNFIEFDYIFTGKNVDILEFDMKMEMGLAFFSLLGAVKTIPNQRDSLQGLSSDMARGGSGGALGSQQSAANVKRTQTPLVGGSQVQNNLLRNKNLRVSTNNFMSAMSRQAAIENIQSRILIRGNPQLLNELNVTPDDLAKRQITADSTTQSIAARWMKIPIYVKVNIMTPTVDGSENFAEKFWYNGWFQILSVTNIFDGNGDFKQDLEMFSMIQTDEFDAVTDLVDVNQTGTIQTTTSAAASSVTGLGRTIEQAQQARATKGQ